MSHQGSKRRGKLSGKVGRPNIDGRMKLLGPLKHRADEKQRYIICFFCLLKIKGEVVLLRCSRKTLKFSLSYFKLALNSVQAAAAAPTSIQIHLSIIINN
ncbi:hypothetical protein NC652_023394 [Populus alba x Populus x berolinensis]|uniref:Uncharacterized protein n=1 Tax=Populus alba x Populus x berolinensis TaxID=444605 RepID=A0AAD6MJ17_9ROSI|nr:hypothetical protein NC652_023394 [Populus alba x Populus x berolinensis]KAJ6986247.1 hypothetical protein NC653_023978 [Populus alba x Populus x berolinensis]